MKNKNLFKTFLLYSTMFMFSCGNASTNSSENSAVNSFILSNTISENSEEVISSNDILSSEELLSESISSSIDESSSSEELSSEETSSEESSSESEINKEELTEGYHLHFSDPKLNNKGSLADDIYLKADINDDGILLSMIGFGTLTDEEYIKIIIHTSEINSSGWNIQKDDVTFLISKNKAKTKTNLTKFWDYVKYASDDTATINEPIYNDYKQYFTLTFLIDYSEIPNYNPYKNVSLFAMEFANGQIYDGIDYNNGMLIDGVSHGDPAAQTSYYVIQEKSLPEDQQEIVKDYHYQFSIGSDNIFAKFTRKTSSLTLDMISFSEFGNDDYIRFVVHTSNIDHNSWGLDETDMSFSIYKNVCYYQTGKTNFWDNEGNQFHTTETSLYNPIYYELETYWTLSIEFEYSEFSLEKNILIDTPLRGILVEFTPSIGNTGFKQNNVALGDIANQTNYFTF